jgi:hypothetical protein
LPQCPNGAEQIWQYDHVKQFTREAVVTNIPRQNKAGKLREMARKYGAARIALFIRKERFRWSGDDQSEIAGTSIAPPTRTC